MHREYDLIDESLTEFSQDICSHTHTHTHTHNYAVWSVAYLNLCT